MDGLDSWLPEEANENDSVTLVNETGLPDDEIYAEVTDFFVENASFAWGRETRFQRYSTEGNMLARREYRAPSDMRDEIAMARDLAERDDDVGSAIAQMISTAFSDGMENLHEDERTVGLYNAAAREMNLDVVLKNLYREYLITSSLTTVTLFTRKRLEWETSSGESRTESVAVPSIGILPAENVRVVGDDIFGTAELALDPEDEKLRAWLEEYFNPNTSNARKAELGRQNRVAAAMFTGKVPFDPYDFDKAPRWGSELYGLNPSVVHRTTMPKGSWAYPRPLVTRNFPLLEAKRLLNILDFSLLQGGANFIVVVKKGSDQKPATRPELKNLQNVVRAASKTGVVLGDHRLDFDIITPDLSELLNPEKRRLLGRKLASTIRRLPEAGVEEPGQVGMETEVEMMSRVIESDRHDIKRHIERSAYKEMERRNPNLFTQGAAKVWFPKVILQGTQYFTDYILKLRDRGDIPRKWAVEAAGFDYEAAIHQRQREIDAGHDEIMQPGDVPFSSDQNGPQDNQPGRTPGGTDPAEPRRTLNRNRGETVTSWFDDEVGSMVKAGNATLAVLEEYPDYTLGRISAVQREAIESGEVINRGGMAAVPVNHEVQVTDEKAVRLRDGLSMVVGQRKTDHALFAKLLVFREPEFSADEAHEIASRWGFQVPEPADES